MASTMSGLFANLGSALLDRFSTTGSNFSQSVTVGAGDAAGATGTSGVAGASGHTPQGDIELTVTTTSGVTVEIDMDSGNSTLAVNQKSSGNLSDAERTALANLADGFQQAINGLSSLPPQINLSVLSQHDSSVLSSVNLQVDVTGDGQNNISANVSLDSSARGVKVTDSTGTLNLSVDTSDSATWGRARNVIRPSQPICSSSTMPIRKATETPT